MLVRIPSTWLDASLDDSRGQWVPGVRVVVTDVVRRPLR
jgi:hypothetical protein